MYLLFDAVARELEGAELQLAFHDGGRRDVGESFIHGYSMFETKFSPVLSNVTKAPSIFVKALATVML